jgi:uncharacterized protein
MSKKLSLQEQLLQSGLVSSSQAKTAKTEKNKQAQMQRKNNLVVVDEAKELARKTREEQLAKDLALNQQRQQQEEKKQLLVQIKQLIEANKLPKSTSDDDIAYRFTDNNNVKTVYVSNTVRTQLINGQLAVVKYGKNYEIVPESCAKKIRERDPDRVCVYNETASNTAQTADDPYAAYQVPDDLMW